MNLVSLWNNQVERTPHNIAATYQNESLSYAQLNHQSELLAHHLQQQNVLPEQLIGLSISPSLEMIVAVLGVLKAGAAFVPLDPDYPASRLLFMLEDSDVRHVVTTTVDAKKLVAKVSHDAVNFIHLDAVLTVTHHAPLALIDPNANHLACCIYTSGSTGQPKGVLLEHQAIVGDCLAMQAVCDYRAEDCSWLAASLSFVAALEQLFMPLLHGGRVIVREPELWDAKTFPEKIRTYGISVIDVLPSYWHTLLDAWQKSPELLVNMALRLVILAGEPVRLETVQLWRQQSALKHIRCINAYGMTETAVTVTLFDISAAGDMPSIPIGKAASNWQVDLLNEALEVVPTGEVGEICASGENLARGYLNQAELTAERFILHPADGRRMYRTGDLGRCLDDGTIEYVGRKDHQVQLRGFRIELGEVEAVLRQHVAVNEAVVNVYEGDGNKRLVAYVTATSEQSSVISELRDWAKARLPDYMVPAHIVWLDALPLTPNGKVDRNALPAPEFELASDYLPPATNTEESLAVLWEGLLRCETVGRNANFFELGGHSLLATQLVARIRDCFQIDLPIRAIFEHPILSDLAMAIDKATGGVSLPAIEAQPEDAVKVLSFAQQRLWFLDQLEGEANATYNMPAALKLSGALDLDALQQSLLWLIERHTSLRSYFPSDAGEAYVLVQSMDEIDVLAIHDLSHLACEAQQQEVQTLANKHAIEPFDLANGPLFKAALLQLSEDQAALLLNMHHIISDGWSMGVFVRDWQHAYTAFIQGEQPSLPALAIQYSDYAAWQRSWLKGEALQVQVDYWQEKLRGIPELLELPTDKKRPAQQSYRGCQYTHVLPASLSQDIAKLSRQQGVTLFMTLLTTFNILLSRYSRQNDVCVGSPIANRTHSHSEDLIGFFVNTLVLRSQIEPDQSFVELLKVTRQTCLEAYAHQDIPFETLVEALQPTRSLSHSPLFQVMFVLQNTGSNENEFTLPDIDIKPLETTSTIAKFDLTLNVEEQDGELHCNWEYATDLFEVSTIKRMAQHFELLLTAIDNHSEQPISQLSMLSEPEVQQLQFWNDTATDYPKDKTIVDLFEQQVENTPDNIAVVFPSTSSGNLGVGLDGEQSLTYRQLNEKANQLAHYLLALKTDDGEMLLVNNPLVAISVERSLDMVIGLLAILKAGGAYVPIDPTYPSARIQHMLDDSAAPLLLTQSYLIAQLSLNKLKYDCVILCFDALDLTDQSTGSPKTDSQPDDLVYVLYTSGSSGIPKGVCTPHHAVSRLVKMTDYIDFSTSHTFLQLAPLAFDASTFEIWGSLLNGNLLVLLPKQQLSLVDIGKALKKYEITTLWLTSGLFHLMIDEQLNDLSGLKQLLSGGDVLSTQAVKKIRDELPDCRIINGYGPTENTTFTTCCLINEAYLGNTVPIGKPIANTQVYILDTEHRLVPIGTVGELCASGSGLARGYLNRPELTAEKFIEVELFGKMERIYKTGDLARWLPDGNLEYLGRIDQQVKLRGFRIELGEIEAVISQHAAVKEAVVNLYETDGNKRLVAYVTVASDQSPVVSELHDWLKEQLPDYMVPALIMVLDALPLTPNGKINRKALPAPELNFTHVYEAPRNDIEQQLIQLWSSLLSQKNIGIHDNFFELGGDSILSIQVVARARKAGLHLTPRDLFDRQTIAELAMVVGVGSEVDAEQGVISGDAALTPIQHWFLSQRLPEPWHFNQSILLSVPADLNVEMLRQGFATVLAHHDVFRLRYRQESGLWIQSFVSDEQVPPFSEEDLRGCTDPGEQLTQLTLNYQRSLNLSSGPLTRLVLFKLGGSFRLFWCIHHLIVDGVSWRILQDDLHTAYSQLLTNTTPKLSAKTSSFKAWAERLHGYAESEAVVAELPMWEALPVVSLPVDNPSGENRLEHHQSIDLHLNKQETEALLRKVPAAYNTRINDILLAALFLTLTDWTKEAHCLIDLEGHGRAALFDDIDLSRTVGWFTTTHPVLLGASGTQKLDLAMVIKTIKEQLRQIPHDGIAYGLLHELGGNDLPKADILFNYLGQFDQGIEAELFSPANEATGSDISLLGQRDHLIDINGLVMQGELHLNWSYSGDCYQVETITLLAQQYKAHLQRLICHCQQGKQGVTPSDFPLTTISQLMLDALYEQRPLQDLYPLSPMQQGMLFHALYESETGVYFEQMRLTLSNLDPQAYKSAWQHQLERHPIFRTGFLVECSPILQRVQAEAPLIWREQDWRGLTSEVQQSQLDTLLQQERALGFDLATAPLMRFDLIRLDNQRYEFIQHFHHLLLDGWCLPIMFSEVRDSYLSFKQGHSPQLPTLRPYRDYIAWLQQQDSNAAKNYWQQRLSGFIAPTALSILGHKSDTPDYRDADYALDAACTRQLQRFSQQQRVTINTIVQAAWALLLGRYSRESDVCFGVTVSGRNAPISSLEQMMGLFINTLPLRIVMNPECQVNDLLQQIQSQHQDDNHYAHHPLFEIQNSSDVANGTALFESLLVFENYPLGDALEQSDACYKIEQMQVIEFTNYPLTVAVMPGDILGFKISYDNHRIDTKRIEYLWGHLNTILSAIIENPAQPIAQLAMLTEPEIQQLQLWNDTATDYPKDKTIVDLFEQQVEETPDNIAVVFPSPSSGNLGVGRDGEQSLTYRQLNEKANQLAHYLLALKTDDGEQLLINNPLVAIAVERSLDMVIGLLAILKAGGGYVPIDPAYPSARIRHMLDDSAAPLLLTQSPLTAQLPLDALQHHCCVVCLDTVTLTVQHTECLNPIPQVNDLAYVIYTSGSTGKPKGVMIEHGGLVNLASAQIEAFQILPESRVLQFASFSFDASISEITTALVTGAALYLVSKEILLDTTIFTALITKQQISHITLPPSFLNGLSEQSLTNLKTLVVAGEACPTQLMNKWANKLHFINAYGPTEGTICASLFKCTADGVKPTIGEPIANTRIYVLDAQDQLQPSGIPGELCIAGSGLARGYLNLPELTAEKFIEVELFGKTERIYKTGDLARWLSDGNLEYLGRIDQQVKLRGFRIELGEIEAVISQHTAVKDAVVNLYETDDNKRLVAYVTVARGQSPVVSELRDWLKEQLPDYMVPALIMVLDAIPLTPNGKIDRKALPAPELNFTHVYEAPRNDIEQQLIQLWSSLLSQKNIGIHDNFFELGGDSILSIQVVARARKAGLHLTPRDLFDRQTIAELAMVVGVGSEVDAEQGVISGDAALTPIQHWFFSQSLPEPWHFNQSILLSVSADLNVAFLRQAFDTVFAHHDVFRLHFRQENDLWTQSFVNDEQTTPFSEEDLSDCTDSGEQLTQLTLNYQRSLNLSNGPLTRLVLFKLGDSFRLFWCIHHLIVDGVSWRILQEDLHTAYSQLIASTTPKLPAKTSSFKTWSERLHGYAESEAVIAELPMWEALPVVSIPVDNLSGENWLEYHQSIDIHLDRQETKALLREVPAAYNTRINDVLLAALFLTLTDWTKESYCLIDLENHGRAALFDDIDLSRTVGWFTTTHPVLLGGSGTQKLDLATVIKTVKEQLRQIPHDGIAYGLLRELGGNELPKADILFNYLGQFDQGIEAELFGSANEATGSDISLQGQRDHLIDINALVMQGELHLNWSYSGDCYQVETITLLAQQYKAHLQQLIYHCQQGKQGVTPSDFPLATIAQPMLDELYTQYPLQDLYPLSPMQQGMLFHALYESETGVYFEQMRLTLSNLDPQAYKSAWQHQLERHPIFRTAFLVECSPILQRVQVEAPLIWREQDWRDLTSEVQQKQLDSLLQQERSLGFDLATAPLMRFDLIRLDDQRYEFIQHHHHLLLDGWCLPIMFSEVRDSYLSFKLGRNPQLPALRPYRDYIAWLQQQDSNAAKSYWQQRLSGFIAPTALSILGHKSDTPDYRDADYALDAACTRQLQRFSQQQRVTLNTIVQAAWALLLGRYSRESDVCFGVTVSGRNAPLSGIEQMMGLFINTLPLRIEMNPECPVNDFLQQIQSQHQDDNHYAHHPLFEIQNSSDVANGTALFESLLVFENYPLGDALEQSDACYKIEQMQGIEFTNYPLTVAVMPGNMLGFKISYDNHRIDTKRIEYLWGHLNTILSAIIENPAQPISQLAMLTEPEIQQLQLWNDTAADYPKDKTIVDLFEQQVEKTPDNIAVVFPSTSFPSPSSGNLGVGRDGEQSLTYRQLNEKANQLAHYLLALKTDDGELLLVNNPLVAIAVERSLDMVIGLLAILKAGGVYVPIDPSYPSARIRHMLDDSAAPLLLTQRHLMAQLSLDSLDHDCIVVCLDEVNSTNLSTENLEIGIQPEHLAYVIYTSGSTGKPKGVMLEHAGAVNLALFQQYFFCINSRSRILQFASLSFDAASWELLMALCGGGSSLHIVSMDMIHSDLNAVLKNQEITHVTLPPSVANILPGNGLPELKYLIVAGEASSAELVTKWAQQDRQIINAYGPTEGTVCASVFKCEADGVKPVIGHPIANTRIYVLDAQNQLQPSGIPGELCIAGAGLARGYLNRPELTAEKFIEVELFGKIERIYKTGDLARWLPDGNLEYLGRIDQQVKLRGFRIELGEIESVISCYEGIKEAVVNLYTADGNQRLVGYVTVASDQSAVVSELRDWLKEQLPDYMVPTHIMVLDAIPLTPNGKIDRKALPKPDNTLSKNKYESPRNSQEQTIANVWQKVLKQDNISIHHSFFELGGHSLLAMQVYSALKQTYPTLKVIDLFQYPSIHALANHLNQVDDFGEQQVKTLQLTQQRGEKRRNRRPIKRQRSLKRD